MHAAMIVFAFLLIGFMVNAWAQSCATAQVSQVDTCPGFSVPMATHMTQAASALYTLAAIATVFFAIKCMMYPNKQAHIFPKIGKRF